MIAENILGLAPKLDGGKDIERIHDVITEQKIEAVSQTIV